MAWEFYREIRGVEVKVFADDFDGDDSVGIGYGPETLWAETLDGEPFELTAEEEETLSCEATEAVLDSFAGDY